MADFAESCRVYGRRARALAEMSGDDDEQLAIVHTEAAHVYESALRDHLAEQRLRRRSKLRGIAATGARTLRDVSRWLERKVPDAPPVLDAEPMRALVAKLDADAEDFRRNGERADSQNIYAAELLDALPDEWKAPDAEA